MAPNEIVALETIQMLHQYPIMSKQAKMTQHIPCCVVGNHLKGGAFQTSCTILPGAFHLLQSTGSNHGPPSLHSAHRAAYLHPKTQWSAKTDMFGITVMFSDVLISFCEAKLISNDECVSHEKNVWIVLYHLG